QVDRLTPELGEQLALNLDVLHVRGVRRHLDGRDRLIEREPDLVSRKRIKMEAAYGAVEIPRRTIELLSFPLIQVGPDDVAVGALKSGVDVEQGLHVVVARGQLTD